MFRYMEAASALQQESSMCLRRFEVCDNVDLETILMEYESYYFIKFHKYPKLTKKVPETCKSLLLLSHFLFTGQWPADHDGLAFFPHPKTGEGRQAQSHGTKR